MIFIKFLTVAPRKIAKKLWLLALIAIDCAILTYILVSALVPTLYGAEAQVLVTGEEAILDNYARVATSRAVCNKLIDEFELSASVERVSSSIRVEKLGDSSCLSIRVLCEDPATSVILTDALVRHTTDTVSALYEGTATLVYNEATLPTQPYGPDPLLLSLIAFLASLLLGTIGVCIPVLRGYCLIDKKSTEMLLDIPVLGVIPGEKDRNGGNPS
ncbi:MAG: hypothetical protein IJY12_00810 [Clostridia bacterium]|nr:hypothetical protein [Clostridia bacterium]